MKTTDLSRLRNELQSKIDAIDLILGDLPPARHISSAANGEARPKRTMSAAGRAKLRAIAKARWAKARKEGKKAL